MDLKKWIPEVGRTKQRVDVYVDGAAVPDEPDGPYRARMTGPRTGRRPKASTSLNARSSLVDCSWCIERVVRVGTNGTRWTISD